MTLAPRGQARPEPSVPGVLSVDEAIELCDFACRYGTMHLTRLPAEGRTVTRLYAVDIPLVEEFDRRAVSGLQFWRRWAAERVGKDR